MPHGTPPHQRDPTPFATWQEVLFDFPRDGVEYVRRVGRITRGPRAPGRVTSLVLGRQLAYARALMKINREGGAVDLEVHGSADEESSR